MNARRSGTFTFLFTDIEGSTRRWEIDPEGMRADLTAHDAVLRAAIENNNGDWFKHTGDGAAAVFDSAADAVAAAIEAQRGLELPVRMGIATGEAQARDGDYFGPCVNRAARVMSAGHGGQILLADSAAGLVDTRGYIDLGVHTLRDVSIPIRITQVAVDGLPVDFPPVHTVGAVHGNLNTPTLRLVGRHDELKNVVGSVHDHRVVTLTGPGGVGKTRLAEEIAGDVADDFPDGVWVVELAATAESGAVPALVADALNVTVEANASRTESILNAVSGKRLLILLDNCEHVMDGARRLVRLIVDRVDSVTVLATSRQSLEVPGERVWPVPPLHVGDDIDSEAVAFFVERAQAVNPHFDPAPGSDELAAVARVCRELDGLALAIELAAARMVSMSPQDVATRLDRRFQLLAASTEGATPHHRTLYDTVDWSYELLDEDERMLLVRCAAFSSGFEVESVSALCDMEHWDEFTVLDLLDSLVRKSLVVVDMGGERTRYRMLETIRQFAEDRLEESGRVHAVRRAHAVYFAERAERMWGLWNGPEQRTAVDWVDAEIAELRAGFRWAADHGEVAVAAKIASHSAMLAFVLQRFEPVAWVHEIIGASVAADLPQLPRVHTAACVTALVGGHQAAIDHAREAVRLEADPKRDPFEHGWSLFWEAIGHRYLGDLDRWFEICEDLADQSGFARIVGRCGLLGVLAGAGRQDEARAMADDVVRETKEFGNPFWISWAQASWGRAHASDDPVAALGVLRTCLEYTREYRLDYIRTIVLREIAALEGTRGGLHESLEMFSTVIDRYRLVGNRASAATTLGDIAVVLDQLGRPDTAATVYGASLPLGFSIAENLTPVIDSLRTQLGEAKFDECVQVGSSMDFNAAMIYTRRIMDVVADQFELADAE